MNKVIIPIITFIFVFFIGGIIFFGCTKHGKTLLSTLFDTENQVTSDSKETIDSVKETSKKMIIDYDKQLAIYKAYRDRESNEDAFIAQQALLKANNIAYSYNEYIMKNSYLWDFNIPSDMLFALPIITK